MFGFLAYTTHQTSCFNNDNYQFLNILNICFFNCIICWSKEWLYITACICIFINALLKSVSTVTTCPAIEVSTVNGVFLSRGVQLFTSVSDLDVKYLSHTASERAFEVNSTESHKQGLLIT